MTTQSITLVTNPQAHDLQFLEDQINQHNIRATGYDDYRPLVAFIRDDHNTIIAGISGYTWADFCEIAFLWVHTDYRNKGYGRQLLQTAETETAQRGCHLIVLNSYSFQAPDFYQKFGYTINGIDENCPPGHRRYHLQKQLNAHQVSK